VFQWYYEKIILNAITIYQSLLIIIVNEFSLPILLRTLFAPWRQDIAPLRGSLDQVFHILIENIISRFVGFMVRFFTLITGGVVLVLFSLVSVGVFVLLLLMPLFPPATAILYLIYYQERQKKPKTKYTLPQVLSSPLAKDSQTLLPYVETESRQIYHHNQNSYENFLSCFFAQPRILFILNHLGITKEMVLAQSSKQANTQKILVDAAASSKGETITAPDVLFGIYQNDVGIQRFFQTLKITKEDMQNLINFEKAYYQTLHKPSPLLHPELIRSSGGIGRLWSAGYTPTLDRFSREITPETQMLNPLHFEAHKNKIAEIERILGRSGKHNVILVGEPGTGKRTVALGFASRIILGDTIPALAHRRVIEFNLDLLLAGAYSLGETEERLVAALNEAVRAGNIILFVDNIERLFEPKEAKAGSLDISAILLPYLQRNDFQLLGTTSYEGYYRWIESNPIIAANFEKIEIKEPSPEETLKILFEIALYLEAEQNILILYPALKAVLSLATKYLGEKKFPEKAIDLLDEVVSYTVNQKRAKIVSEKEVEEVISNKVKISVGELEKSEKQRLINLEKEIHRRLINQEEAVKAIAASIRRARTGVRPAEKPIGTFLFLGPTGVGKTECAKSLAAAYFGDEKKMIRFDMTEFQDTSAVTRLIGSQKIGEVGLLASQVRENPFSLILLDEIEKTHPHVLNLFLQILDEGKMTDGMGREVDFKNTIIIATSNAGSEWIREKTQNRQPIEKNLLLDFLLKQGLFRPEFLNRFDEIIAFRPLNILELEQITTLMVEKIEKSLAEKQIKIVLTPGARRRLAQIGFDPQLGARQLHRTIQEKVENRIAQAILQETLKEGGTFTISEDMVE